VTPPTSATDRADGSTSVRQGRGPNATAVPRLAVGLAGLGHALPTHRVTNHDLAAHLDTDHAWIVGRTGISARRVAGRADTTTALATRAADAALADAGVAASAVDLVVVATATPDSSCPSTAARVCAELGLRAGGYDVNAACCGFVYALHGATALLADSLGTVLVIGADRFTTLTDPSDRGTAVLFGDGAGALVVRRAERRPGAPGVLGSDVGGDPRTLGVIEQPPGERYLTMDGPDLFRRATRGMVASAAAALDRAGVAPGDVDLFVPHQANARIIGAAADRLGVDPARVVVDVAERANTSAASIPLALHAARADGRLADGATVLLSSVGAGLGWASLVLRWGR
jgi:3-oxoacyl-[acyl-carrier-protein] synthase-3